MDIANWVVPQILNQLSEAHITDFPVIQSRVQSDVFRFRVREALLITKPINTFDFLNLNQRLFLLFREHKFLTQKIYTFSAKNLTFQLKSLLFIIFSRSEPNKKSNLSIKKLSSRRNCIIDKASERVSHHEESRELFILLECSVQRLVQIS